MACCDICGAVFTLTNNLMRHIVMSHNENDPAPIKIVINAIIRVHLQI